MIFDGHNDTVLKLREGASFFERGTSHIDLNKAREGGLAGGLCALFVPSQVDGDVSELFERGEFPATPALEAAQSHIIGSLAIFLRLARESEGQLAIARTAAEIRSCMEAERFAVVLHIEGAEAIDPDLWALDVFYAAGVRSLGPLWSRPNAFGYGVPIMFPGSPDCGPGLTKHGRDLIAACNELRILIDLSHITERGFWDVARLSTAPLVASHSNAHRLTATPRNLTDRQVDAIGDSDGIIGVNFSVNFLRADGAQELDTPLETLVSHIDYLVDRIGIDHVGFGSDFDGCPVPMDLGDAAALPRLVEVLEQSGYCGDDLRKLTHGNWLRVLSETWGK